MHPAFSVIFFTTLSGAGYGLLTWSALAALFNRAQPGALLVGLLLSVVLIASGLLSSLAHLGKPARAWRSFSQWRTSWLSREGVLAIATFVPAVVLVVLAWLEWVDPTSFVFSGHPGPFLLLACLAAVVGSLATVVCTAMIYASLKPIPAWRHAAVVPVYLVFSLLTGGLLYAALHAWRGTAGNGAAIAGIATAIGLAALKWRYWRDIDSTPLTQTRADAVGLPGRNVSVFERPHTESNYLTREMGFIVARKHARRLRWIAIALFALVPVLLLLPVWLFVHLDAAPWLAAAALSALAGAFVERWLFFAEAKHLVTLYY
jgi:DMSO reductase anchor subunit